MRDIFNILEKFKLISSCDWPNKLDEGVSGVDSSAEVASSCPVNFFLSDVLLDSTLVEEPVLGDGDGELFGVGENFSPCLNSGEILIHTGAFSGGVLKVSLESGNVLVGLNDVHVLKVGKQVLSVSLDLDTAGVASLDFFEIVVTGETVNESSDEVWDSQWVEAQHSSGVYWVDWTDSESQQIGGNDTSLPPFLSGPVCLVSGDVSLNSLSVESVVLSDGGSQLLWVKEDLTPFTNGGKIVSHVLACVKSLRNLENNNAEFENCLNFVVPAALCELSESKLDFGIHHLSAGVAGFDFLEVVFGGHSVDEAT